MMPSLGRRIRSGTKRMFSTFSQASKEKFRNSLANTTFSSITANFWPVKVRTNTNYTNINYASISQLKRHLIITNAISWPCRKRNVCIRISSCRVFREKSRWLKLVWIRKLLFIAMKEIRENDRLCSGSNSTAVVQMNVLFNVSCV